MKAKYNGVGWLVILTEYERGWGSQEISRTVFKGENGEEEAKA